MSFVRLKRSIFKQRFRTSGTRAPFWWFRWESMGVGKVMDHCSKKQGRTSSVLHRLGFPIYSPVKGRGIILFKSIRFKEKLPSCFRPFRFPFKTCLTKTLVIKQMYLVIQGFRYDLDKRSEFIIFGSLLTTFEMKSLVII